QRKGGNPNEYKAAVEVLRVTNPRAPRRAPRGLDALRHENSSQLFVAVPHFRLAHRPDAPEATVGRLPKVLCWTKDSLSGCAATTSLTAAPCTRRVTRRRAPITATPTSSA